jgi:hypothetical protein
MNNSRRIRWAEHIACIGEKRNLYRILMGEPEGKKALGRARRTIILKWNLETYEEVVWTGFI